nr:MAG TPA: tail protein [Caudoviricetes sp.]
MTITFFVNGRPLTSVTPEDTSYRYRKISGEDRVHLTFVADRLTTIPVGATIRFEGSTYTLLSPAVITKHNNKSYHHSLTLGAPCERLRLWRMKHRTDGAVKFNLTAKPEEHLRMLIDAASGADTEAEKWTIASCLDAPEKLISYDHTDCLSALGLIAKTFEAEWVAEGKAIRLGKIEANATSPLPLAYGKDKGLKSGLKRENDQRQTLIQRLYVRGSDRNIRHDRYGSKTLHMPKSESVFFDGDRFAGEAGYNRRTEALYLVSPNGDYVERVQTEGLTGGEGSLDATDIYPSRVGSVTKFEQVKGETKDKHPLFAFTDTSIPATLDYTQCLIPNQPLTIAFQSGMLAGQTFEAEYAHKDRRFTIIGKEVDGVWMPEAPYIAKAGDKYAVFSVELPAPYIRDNKTKTGAEWELLRRALKHLHEATQHPYVYRADLDGLWAKKDWTNRGGAIRLGGYVRLSDPELIPYGVDLRITGIKDYLISPETPEIELGTGVSASSILTTIEQMRQDGARQEEAVKEVRQEGSRNYKQALEASEQIARATAERFSSSISPATIKTMQLIAGDPQTQLRFKTPANWTPEYNKDTQVLRLPAGQIEWLYNPSRTLSSSEPNAGKVWTLPEMRTPALSDPNKSYYIYARCNNGVGASLTGAFVVDTNPRELNDGSATCLLLGLLSSADDTGARSFSRLYGFTEILPSQIRTERITSADGSTSINLNTGEIVSDKIKFRHPDGGEKPYPSDYLHEAIHEGTTDIQGGVVLGTLIGAKDTSGKIRSYISGKAGAPALAAGVKGLEEGQETYQTAIHHDGSADFGYFHIRHPQGQGAAGSHLYLENYRYRDSPDIENPYAVKIGDTHPDIKVISRGKLVENVVVNLPTVELTGMEGGANGRVEGRKEVEVVIQPKDLGRYLTATSKVDVKLTFTGVAAHMYSFSSLKVSASAYPSYPPYAPEVKMPNNGGTYSFSCGVNPDGTLVFYLLFVGNGISRVSKLAVRVDIRVTSDSRRDRGTYLTQSGFLVFHNAEYYINADRSRLPYVDAVSGAIRNAGNVMLEVAGGLRVKGAMDTSGILLGGRVYAGNSSFNFEHKWGARADRMSISRTGTGTYLVTHDIGHTRYSVICMDAGNGRHNAKVGKITANSFEIYTKYDNTLYSDINFTFLVFGDNY